MISTKELKKGGQKPLNKKQEQTDKNNWAIVLRIIIAKLAINPVK
jgi:hypothetical protein